MFLRPQHFQQQDRYMERFVDGRFKAMGAYNWGLNLLKIDKEPMKLGKISISEASGVFPDGTPFNAPDFESLPSVLEIPENTSNQLIYLCIPLRRNGAVDTCASDDETTLARYRVSKFEARNSASSGAEKTEIQIGKLCLELKLETQDRSGYVSIAIAKVIENNIEQPIKLDQDFIPATIDCNISTILRGYFDELNGMLKQRGEALGHRLADSGRSGSAEIADYMLLQLVNRLEPLTAHLAKLETIHPLTFYSELIQMAGELATFTTTQKRPPLFPNYQHDNLQECFYRVFSSLRQQLSMVLEQTAVSLNLTQRKYGIYVAPITDPSLISTSTFVIAVSAAMPSEAVRTMLPTQCKIAPVERIRELITTQLPGMMLRPLPVAPRQVPYHAGFNYFEIDRNSELFAQLASSGGIAVHLSGEYPELTLELWAIRD